MWGPARGSNPPPRSGEAAGAVASSHETLIGPARSHLLSRIGQLGPSMVPLAPALTPEGALRTDMTEG